MTGRRDWNDPDYPPFAGAPDIACAAPGVNPEIFFPTPGSNQHTESSQAAKRICRTCPYMAACRTWALSTRQAYGVWGGLNSHERRRILEGAAA
jgi:WhiB family redox-sensing transcriptional regulator